jgi:hypothetical protein
MPAGNHSQPAGTTRAINAPSKRARVVEAFAHSWRPAFPPPNLCVFAALREICLSLRPL